ncbi:hypothetical protein [Streptomyces silvensis]|uniref:Aromatic ring-opening dioxygenase LigA n=1 Tax=Streptomyces silvensis TaxID=1765722 RepID=A0A0W7X5X8_9ACTN|nr:hypothetical protein [Streptomyces silvensis]KUF18115.1 hypothetical protein AT728_21090 [Streptomyces silvensis]
MERRRFVAGTVGALSGIALGTGAAGAAVPAARAHDPRVGEKQPRAQDRPGAKDLPRAQDWRAVPAPGSTPAAQLRHIAAAGPRLAWAVGEEARYGSRDGRALAMLWDGQAWARTDLAHLRHSRLLGVAGTCATAAWSVGMAVGTASPLLRWDGATWRESAFPGSGEQGVRLTAVAVGADRRVWAGGSRAGSTALLHGDGKTWRWLDPLPATGVTVHRVVPHPSGDVWVGGDQSIGGGWAGFVARWNGAWTVLPTVKGTRMAVSDLHPAAADDIWVVGSDLGVGGPPGRPGAAVLSHWDGKAWTRAQFGFTIGALTGIAADDQGRAAWITGWNHQDRSRGTYLRRDGSAWTVVRGPAGPAPAPYLNDVTRVPGTATYWSVGMTHDNPTPPTEAYTERLDA